MPDTSINGFDLQMIIAVSFLLFFAISGVGYAKEIHPLTGVIESCISECAPQRLEPFVSSSPENRLSYASQIEQLICHPDKEHSWANAVLAYGRVAPLSTRSVDFLTKFLLTPCSATGNLSPAEKVAKSRVPHALALLSAQPYTALGLPKEEMASMEAAAARARRFLKICSDSKEEMPFKWAPSAPLFPTEQSRRKTMCDLCRKALQFNANVAGMRPFSGRQLANVSR